MKKIDIRETIPKHKTRKPKKRKNISHIVIHTTASGNQDPNLTAMYHVTPSKDNHVSKRGCPSICYHDFIDTSGTVYHCVDYSSVTWHAGFYNSRSIGVAIAFRGQLGIEPGLLQYKSLVQHLVILCLYFKILPENVIGHREVPGMWKKLGNGSKRYKKLCPGMGVDLDELRYEITGRLQKRLSAESLYHGKIDCLFGPKSIAALMAFNPVRNKSHKIRK